MPFQKLVKMAGMWSLLFLTAIHVRGQSALDGFKPSVNSLVHVVVVQPDGKILIAGDFTSVGGVARNHIARLNPDGALDTAFDPNTNGRVLSMAVQADGKILVGGVFTNVGGQNRNNIARLNATTGLPDSFNPNANGGVEAIVLQADGKILMGGNFNAVNGGTRNHIVRLDPATGLPDSFDPSPNAIVYSLAVQVDGKILAGGDFTGIGGQLRNRIARVDAINGLADSFNPNANHIVRSLAVQADGKVLAGGSFNGPNSIGGQTRNGFARLDPASGSADSLDANIDGTVYAIAVQADGKILAAGSISSSGGQTHNNVIRIDPTTGQPDSFDPDPNALLYTVAVQQDGKILVGGQLTAVGGQQRLYIARLETDGRVDQTLDSNIVAGPGGNGFVVATAIQPDGKIVIGGQFNSVLGVTRHNIARLNTDGTLDMAFDPNANAEVDVIAVQPDGKIVVGGNFSAALGQPSIGGQTRNRIARLDPTTGLADSFNPGAGAVISAIVIQADGKILVGGSLQGNSGGQLRRFIARFDPITGLADSFNPDPDNTVFSIAIQRDGKILIGGVFSTIVGFQPRNRLARLDPTTGEADSFNPNPNNTVDSIVVQTDGKILVGGSFTTISGQARNFFARLDGTSGLADSFNPGADRNVYTFAVQADGKILAVGEFTSIGGQMRNHIARLDGMSALADSLNPTATNFAPSSVTLQADGKILAAGRFSGPNSIGGQSRDFLARLSNDTAALQNLSVTQTTATWTRGGSSPEFTRVTFEISNDNVNYTALGNGTVAGRNWVLSGLNLPIKENFYVRARGYWGNGHSQSITESVRNAFILQPGTLGNISTRLRVQTGDNAMIGGFIITGTQRKTVIVRGIGPSLPIPGALADPVIEVYGSSGQLLAVNDNWNDSLTRQQIIDSGLAPTNDLESALWGVIDPGAYTVVVRGNNNGAGIGLFEVYDLDPESDSKLANVSTRGFVETGNNVMIAGAILRGSASARVLLRAIGPSLTNFGVSNTLPDPTLELHDGNGALIAANDNWRTDQEAQIIATGLPPSNNLESAIVRDLFPGNYTAIVRGTNNMTGVALIEAYELN